MSVLLTINAGSSTLKLSAWRLLNQPQRRWRLVADLHPDGAARISTNGSADEAMPRPAIPGSDAIAHLDAVLATMPERDAIDVVAHRIVHGGDHTETVLAIDASLRRELESLTRFVPLHQPAALALLDAAIRRLPAARHFACFDTSFHANQPEIARRYALPERYWQAGIKAYGFHGLSYASVLETLARIDQGFHRRNLVIAHLGNGASACAIAAGRSVATTMGFSALDGLVMGTRCGRIDPGVLIHLARHEGLDAEAMEHLLYRQSGLLGVSGLSGDVRNLLAAGRPEASRALELFCHRAASEIASLLPSLSSFDALVFTGGIGEHAAPLRAAIVQNLAIFGLRIDPEANSCDAAELTGTGSSARILVCASDEEALMARESSRLYRMS